VWRGVLETLRQRVKVLIANGKTLEQAVAAKPTADLDAKMGDNFIKPDQIVEAAYKSMAGSAAASASPARRSAVTR
jgi:cyclase